MSDKVSKGGHVAYCDEVDDGTGRRITGTRTYARADGADSPTKSRPPSAKPSPEAGNITRSASSSTRASYVADSDSATSSSKGAKLIPEKQKSRDPAAQPRRSSQTHDAPQERRVPSDRRRRDPRDPRDPGERPSRDPSATAPRRQSSTRQARPAMTEHANTMHTVPQVKQGRRTSAEYYGGYSTFQTPTAPPTRPRSKSRPNSFIGVPSGPGQSVYPPNAYPRGSAPLPPQQAVTGYPYPYPPGSIPAHSPIGPPPPYYNVSPIDPSDHLSRRFDGGSAMPQPDQSPIGYGPDPYRPKVVRRPSDSARRHEIERQMMPPPDRIPQRTVSAVPSHPAVRAPPPGSYPVPRPSRSRGPSHHRRSVDFSPADDDFHYNEYTAARDVPSRQPNHVIEISRPGRRSTVYEPVDILPAGRRVRRSSMYGAPMSHYRETAAYEKARPDNRYDDAMAYQNEVNGGYQQPLTAEALQKMRHNVPSSRSTRSSGSRDDSDYRRSLSTALTGASSVGPTPEGMTVEIKGNGSVHIDRDGGVHITHPNGGSSRLASDRGGAYYQLEDMRGRSEQKSLPYRPRPQSRPDSFSRGHTPHQYHGYDPSNVF